MPNLIDANGLQTETQAELIAKFTAAYEGIYGSGISLSQDSPDGQMMMFYIQVILDVLDVVKQTNASFDPDEAIGAILDQRVAINGIKRQAGTYTITPITIVTSIGVNLYGLDQSVEPVYTIQDLAGNQWQLQNTVIGVPIGSNSYNFRSATPGANLTIVNTINTPVTIVLGVSSVNNPATYTELGISEESNYDLKIRRQKSVALSSTGFLAGLRAALLNINGVTYTKIYENRNDAVDGDGTPGHCIWVVVGGTATDEQIATAIYKKRNGGCNMRGAESYTVTQLDGSLFIVNWDVVVTDEVYIQFDASSLDGVIAPLTANILATLPTLYTPDVYEKLNINDLATYVQQIDNNCLVTNAGFSSTLLGSYTTTLLPSAKNRRWSIAADKIAITVV